MSCGRAAITSRMWVATMGDQMIRSFTINRETGQVFPITTTGNPVPTGAQPSEMVMSPDGKTIFLANSGGTVTTYTVNQQDGSLSVAGSPAAAGQMPVALAVDPTGKFLFVANQGTSGNASSGTISAFSISGTSLTPVPGSPFPTEVPGEVGGSGPTALAVSPAGNFLYVANQFSNTVQSFSFDSSGALTLIATYPAGTAPSGLALSRCAGITAGTATANCPAADGNNLFVANSGSNNVSIFSACIQISGICPVADGSLRPIPSGSPVTAATGPATIFVNPGQDFVYAIDRGSNEISEYQYVPATGALTFLANGSGGAAVFSGGITANTVNSPTTFNWVVLTNGGGSSLSIFRVAASGKLIALTAGQFSIEGQPSAILLR